MSGLAEGAEAHLARILLVEDNEGDVFLISRALKEAAFPHILTVIRDGADAMALLNSKTSAKDDPLPDLVMLDLNLPRVDGTALVELFRSQPVLQNIPVVLLSSSSAPHDRAKARELKRGMYVIKPSDLDSFMDIGRQVKAFWIRSQEREDAVRS
jgi:CheY-like chemotaxis protein